MININQIIRDGRLELEQELFKINVKRIDSSKQTWDIYNTIGSLRNVMLNVSLSLYTLYPEKAINEIKNYKR